MFEASKSRRLSPKLGLPVPWSDRLAGAGWRLLGWLFNGMMAAPVWLMWCCVLFGTVVLILTDFAVRRAFHLSKGGTT